MNSSAKGKKRGLRTGFTTGACAAAAAKAATRVLVGGSDIEEIETTLPNGDKVRFALERCEQLGNAVRCGIIKDAGDDPDCTHGAELIATVELREDSEILIEGGEGVARVTKAGLGLEVGTWAINPVPRKNIRAMVLEELEQSSWTGAKVVISVPGGEEMAKKTTNARLGLLGGISILGTTGIVRPYSTAAFKASVCQQIDVVAELGLERLVFTTGGKSEGYAMNMFPALGEACFVQVGDFIGIGIRRAARRQLQRVDLVAMMGKLSKMAKGKMQTHVAGSKVDLQFLSEVAHSCGASPEVVEEIAQANTARHVLEICTEKGIKGVPDRICALVAQHCKEHVQSEIPVYVWMVDFGGALIGLSNLELEAELPPREEAKS